MRRTQNHLRRVILLLACIFLIQSAFSWGVTGHRIVAEIADQHLSKKAKREIKKLIGNDGMPWWSNWGDFIKSDSTWDHAFAWHYINMPGNLPKAEFLSALKALPAKNLYTQIQEMAAQMKNKALPIEERQIALRLFIHFVGDLHQPLHIGRAEDQGANKIVVYWFDKKTNLHTLWDSGLIDFQQYSYSEYAKLLDKASKEKIKEWQATTLDDCFFETYQLSNAIYASTTNEAKLSYKYNHQFQHTLDEQLLKGGIRLAGMLNAIFE